eukprot:4612635-Amphidinium_carterae.1
MKTEIKCEHDDARAAEQEQWRGDICKALNMLELCHDVEVDEENVFAEVVLTVFEETLQEVIRLAILKRPRWS